MALFAQLRSKRKLSLNHSLLAWQLKSRAKWALEGDSNTKHFHMLASGRRNQNSIWSLSDEAGNTFEDETTLKDLGESHFSNIFKDDGGTCLYHHLKVILLYPRMIPMRKPLILPVRSLLGKLNMH